MTHVSRISLDRIAQAASVIDPVFLNSPQFLAESLSAQLGCRVVMKVETINPIRSFKGRGAEYVTATLVGRPQLVCASAGNFGQGMAFAARKRGLSLIVFAAINANPLKIERMRALGAEVRQVGAYFDAAKQAARTFALETGATFIEDSRDVGTAEGAGTIGIELLRWPEPFDALLIPLGNGALLAGIAHWVKAHHPATKVIGVCASGAPAMQHSWRSGEVEVLDSINTIADGIGVRVPVLEALEDLADTVDDILLVDDQAMLQCMRLIHTHLGLVAEPSGAAGLAALLTYGDRFHGQLVSTILCGSNLTPEQMEQWLTMKDEG